MALDGHSDLLHLHLHFCLSFLSSLLLTIPYFALSYSPTSSFFHSSPRRSPVENLQQVASKTLPIIDTSLEAFGEYSRFRIVYSDPQ